MKKKLKLNNHLKVIKWVDAIHFTMDLPPIEKHVKKDVGGTLEKPKKMFLRQQGAHKKASRMARVLGRLFKGC